MGITLSGSFDNEMVAAVRVDTVLDKFSHVIGTFWSGRVEKTDTTSAPNHPVPQDASETTLLPRSGSFKGRN